MKNIITFYAVLLVFYSIVMLVFILVGSHGKLVLENRETLQGLAVALTFLLTAVVFLIRGTKSIKGGASAIIIILNVITLTLLCYQINLLYPERFTVLSTFILILHLLGLVLGVLIIYRFYAPAIRRMFKNKKKCYP